MKSKAGERAVQVIVALLKSSCYLGLFLGMQVLVMLPVAFIAGIQQAIGGQDTFVQIMETCRELTDAAYAGELDEYRGVMAHNHGIEFEKDDETDIMEA